MSEPHRAKDFVTAWRRVDRSMQSWPLPDGLDARVLAARSADDRRWLWWLALTATAALSWIALGPTFAAKVEPATVTVRFDPPRCRPAAVRPTLTLDAGCVVLVGGPPRNDAPITVRAQSALRLRHTTRGIRVVEGRATFEMPALTVPVRVLVSGGGLEVLGSRFTVDQNRGGGRVSVDEGRVAFVGPDGARSALLPGDTLSWRPTVAWPSERTAARVRAIADLRARGLYAAAEAQIRALLRAPIDVDTAEVLSYERGTLLDGPLRRPDDACAHWAAHRGRFPRGRYETVVTEALSRCRVRQETR